MGIKLFGSSVGNTVAPNPDPSKFFILKSEDCGTHCVLQVQYDRCTTFNGQKLLLCKQPLKVMLSKHMRKSLFFSNEPLDPHLLGGEHPVIARFEPTLEGWKLAILCAKELAEKNTH